MWKCAREEYTGGRGQKNVVGGVRGEGAKNQTEVWDAVGQ
jgi:hypothetical protein